jgi:hypothetical protein
MLKIALMLGLGLAALLPSQAANAGSTAYSLRVQNNSTAYRDLDVYQKPPNLQQLRQPSLRQNVAPARVRTRTR